MAVLPRSMEPPNGFVFDEPEGRPFRITSVETEVDGDGDRLARTLDDEGILMGRRVHGYGYHPGNRHTCLAYIKFDGSVTGGELVFDRINLTDAAQASAMLRAHQLMRGLEKGGHIAYNPNCGGHIHLDAYRYGFYDLLRLIVLFGHLEEPIFRLAGAGKTYGHRTLYKGYVPHNGHGYSFPIVKGPWGEISEAFRYITGMDRHSGINTTIYSQNGCRSSSCPGKTISVRNKYGETYDYKDMKSCVCPTVKHTVEWRVWNSQGNPRILYAWIALMQAMHAYAWRPANVGAYSQWDAMESLDWKVLPFSRLPESTRKTAQERVEWMFAELPLTPSEKDALRYSFMRTPYKTWGKGWLQKQADTPYKQPPYPNTYESRIKRTIAYKKDGTPWAEGQAPVEAVDIPFDDEPDYGPDDGPQPPRQDVQFQTILQRLELRPRTYAPQASNINWANIEPEEN